MQMKRYIHSRPFIALTIIFLSFPCHSFLKTRFSTSCLHTWLVCQIFFLQVTCAPLFWTECFRCKVYLNTSEEVCQIRWSITFFELPYCASPTHNRRRTLNSSDLRYWRNQCCYWFFRFRSYVSLLKYSSWPAWYCSGWVRIVCFETSRRDLNHLIATALGGRYVVSIWQDGKLV